MKTFATILVLIALLVLGFLAYMGFFSNITVAEKEVGPYNFVYKDFVGDYAKTGPVFNEVYEVLKENGAETTKGLGIYYDDPEVVLKDDLKSRVGSLVTDEQLVQIEGRGVELNTMTVDPFNAVIAEFPLKKPAIFSIIFGIQKVYPVTGEYIAEKGYGSSASYELYDYDEGKIFYMFPIVK